MDDTKELSSDELMAMYPDAKSPDHAREMHRVAQSGQGLSPEAQAEQERIAAFNAHPHTMLNKLLEDLRKAPPDMHARLNLALGGVARLAQIIIQHTPPPDQERGVRDESPATTGGQVG